MISALQKSECCSAISATFPENGSATSVCVCGSLEGWGLGLADMKMRELRCDTPSRYYLEKVLRDGGGGGGYLELGL